ncbi:MAG: RHS repeat protein [Acidobacteria bacterium]|nr:RHS repeat protein [Acidobacteriota bacterium]
MSFRYDSGGNLIEKTDARGISTIHTYDALNRKGIPRLFGFDS